MTQQEWTSMLNMSSDASEFNTTLAKELLLRSHTNTFNFLICHQDDYTNAVRLLRDTEGFLVDGSLFRLWFVLLPPSEGSADRDNCTVPPDSPLTLFNETAIFASGGNSSLGYLNYAMWGRLLGLLAQEYPHLVALNMDDCTHDIRPPSGIFTPELVASITANMRMAAPWLSFIPTVYYSEVHLT